MKEILISISVVIVFLIPMLAFTVSERDGAYFKQKEYQKLLIDFGHARYIVDPVTGIIKFEIDPVPVTK